MAELDLEKFAHTQLSKLSGAVEFLQQGRFELTWSIRIARILGYGLLVLAFFDLIETFMSLELMNALSQFQTIGTLVERVPVTLIGLVLVFLGGLDERNKWELLLLKILSWLTLLVGILFILLIPLGIGNTVQINNILVAQVNTQYEQKISQVKGFEDRLRQATPENVLDVIKRQGGSAAGKTPQQIKDELLSKVDKSKAEFKTQADASKWQQQKSYLKKAVKWNLGALISGFLFISIWKYTDRIRTARVNK
jgi:hypothetical protein